MFRGSTKAATLLGVLKFCFVWGYFVMIQARENETEAAREARLAHMRDHAAEVWLFVVLIGDQLVINPTS